MTETLHGLGIPGITCNTIGLVKRLGIHHASHKSTVRLSGLKGLGDGCLLIYHGVNLLCATMNATPGAYTAQPVSFSIDDRGQDLILVFPTVPVSKGDLVLDTLVRLELSPFLRKERHLARLVGPALRRFAILVIPGVLRYVLTLALFRMSQGRGAAYM